MKLLKKNAGAALYLPESFEWLILKSGAIDGKKLNNILDSPEKYIESSHYFSWERFFTDFLVSETTGSYLQYSKKKLNPVYLHSNIAAKILSVVKSIDL